MTPRPESLAEAAIEITSNPSSAIATDMIVTHGLSQEEAALDVDVPFPTPPTIFHATPKALLPQILKGGLLPQNGQPWNGCPARVYFSPSEEESVDIAGRLARAKAPGTRFVILRVAADKVNPPLACFVDSCMQGAFYSTASVPPHAITVVRELPWTVQADNSLLADPA